MVAGLPDVQPDEHVNVLLIQNHRNTRSLVRPPLTRTGWSNAAVAGIHATEAPSSCL
jgi:hypothetical protein